jgi:hypothetical protein
MAMDFSKFDATINQDELNKQLEEAKNNAPQGDSLETPAGNYVAKVEKMELGATKDGRPMFKVQLRVIEAGENANDDVIDYLKHFKNKKPCLFMNRVIYGTKNDANMIQSVIGWLQKLEPSVTVEFKNYSQFADLILDIFEEVADAVELDVNYDPDSFNSISIEEVFDAE